LERQALEVNKHLQKQLELQQQLAKLQADKQLWEAQNILSESCKEGAINGSNAEKRKMQALIYLNDAKGNDLEYELLCDDHDASESRLQQVRLELQMSVNILSVLKREAELTAAVLRSLAG